MLGMETKKSERLWTHLHWLTVLAEQGSFTSAALRLSVSKAAMSQRIAELERAAGVPLVTRTTRSVQLTEAGRQLVDRTRTAFDHIADSFAGIQDLAASPRGLLRVTAPVAFAQQQLVGRLPRFLHEFAEIRLELDLADGIRSLAGEGFDLAIRHTEVPPDTHVAWKLCQTRSVLVASPAYLRQFAPPSHPQDLAQHKHLHYPRPQSTAAWTFERLGARKAQPERIAVPVRAVFVANNSEVLRDMALADAGMAVLPDFSAQTALQAGQLIHVLPEWTPVGTFGSGIYAIRPYAAHVPRTVQALVAFLRQEFKGGFGTTRDRAQAGSRSVGLS
jgi:DNA-binding transcriptional LysR family regulator